MVELLLVVACQMVALNHPLIQGVRKFPPQLCQALASSYVDTMKYPLTV